MSYCSQGKTCPNYAMSKESAQACKELEMRNAELQRALEKAQLRIKDLEASLRGRL